MSRHKVLFAVAGAVIFLSSAAQAGLVLFESTAPSTFLESGASIIQKNYSFDSITLEMNAQSNSPFTVTLNLTNLSGDTWTGYLLELDPTEQATFVPGSGKSTDFQSVLEPDVWTIEFQAPDEVPHGGSFALMFQIDIPDGTPILFSLKQTPIPEPATVVFLGLGALACLARPKK